LTQTDPQGRQANYTYHSNGNLTSALDNSNSMGLHSSYNPDGTVSKITQDVIGPIQTSLQPSAMSLPLTPGANMAGCAPYAPSPEAMTQHAGECG
jgi:YD repeat-containing protein